MRTLGPTFDIKDIGFIDFETASPVNIKEAGLYRYMAAASPLVLAAAIGTAEVRTFEFPLTWDDLPDDLKLHHYKVQTGKAKWAAWNAAFDREVWNQLTDFLPIEHDQMIDVMAQATAAGLPGALSGASRFSGDTRKISGGELIKTFSTGKTTKWDKPEEWQQFLEYAAMDVDAMRSVFLHTLQLPIEDWEEYWASERINLNGIAFDRELARAADVMAMVDREQSGKDLYKLTTGAVSSVTQVPRITAWLNSVLHPADREYMVRAVEEETDEETGEEVKVEKLSLNRRRIQNISVLLDAKPKLDDGERRAREVLDIRQYGGSTTPAKFRKMLASNIDGLLLGQFVFNGASQTGRFSSRGIQLHNLMRDALPYELDAIDVLRDGCSHEVFRGLGEDMAVSRKLSMLIRPTLVPERSDSAFVWGDWSQIEARVLPWLAGADERLNIFREVDDDPSKPDLYVRSAAAMSGIDIGAVTPELRQRGKVAELACQFGGGRGALQNMAANYGMYLTDEQASDIAREWRAANGWARAYWDDLWSAFHLARQMPNTVQSAGKVRYAYLPEYLGGSMLCILPSGRWLTYRRVRQVRTDTKDSKGNVIDSRLDWTFARGYGVVKLWHGILAENITQAVAADVLRSTLVRLIGTPLLCNVRAHTHDEVLLEVPVERVPAVSKLLKNEMEREVQWSSGLPLKAETTCGYSYTKCKAATGL